MESDRIRPVCIHQNAFSIHAPRMESDAGKDFRYYKVFDFQFTLPVWGATPERIRLLPLAEFSIHAPRMESD